MSARVQSADDGGKVRMDTCSIRMFFDRIKHDLCIDNAKTFDIKLLKCLHDNNVDHFNSYHLRSYLMELLSLI